MGNNLTIQSPNLQKIAKMAGQWTADAINTLWAALNDQAKQQRSDFRIVKDTISPRLLAISAAASVDDLDLQGCSVIQFVGGSAQNFTGMIAPETGQTRLVIVTVTGAGTITAKHLTTSQAANQLSNTSAADVTLTTGKSIWYLYCSSLWRQVA